MLEPASGPGAPSAPGGSNNVPWGSNKRPLGLQRGPGVRMRAPGAPMRALGCLIRTSDGANKGPWGPNEGWSPRSLPGEIKRSTGGNNLAEGGALCIIFLGRFLKSPRQARNVTKTDESAPGGNKKTQFCDIRIRLRRRPKQNKQGRGEPSRPLGP